MPDKNDLQLMVADWRSRATEIFKAAERKRLHGELQVADRMFARASTFQQCASLLEQLLETKP
jgi:hypothetical protein